MCEVIYNEALDDQLLWETASLRHNVSRPEKRLYCNENSIFQWHYMYNSVLMLAISLHFALTIYLSNQKIQETLVIYM